MNPLTYDQTTKIIESYGLPALVVIFLLFLLIFVIKMHKEERKETMELHSKERKEWKETDTQRFDQIQKIAIRSDETLNKISDMIKEMKYMLGTVIKNQDDQRRGK